MHNSGPDELIIIIIIEKILYYISYTKEILWDLAHIICKVNCNLKITPGSAKAHIKCYILSTVE